MLLTPRTRPAYNGKERDEEVMRLTSPEVAVACCGEDNSYGHPHDEVVELCESEGVLLLRTDRDGDITLHSNGAEIVRAA